MEGGSSLEGSSVNDIAPDTLETGIAVPPISPSSMHRVDEEDSEYEETPRDLYCTPPASSISKSHKNEGFPEEEQVALPRHSSSPLHSMGSTYSKERDHQPNNNMATIKPQQPGGQMEGFISSNIDMLNSSMARLSCARILVKIDLLGVLPHSIEIILLNGSSPAQPIIYETLPKFCRTCKVLGHTVSACPKGS
ncbi:hypothetical protein OIU76_020956 [Salix suchowensis]|nr:hypothetical protein OIU76_020956 [Salix suchowensis]